MYSIFPTFPAILGGNFVCRTKFLFAQMMGNFFLTPTRGSDFTKFIVKRFIRVEND